MQHTAWLLTTSETIPIQLQSSGEGAGGASNVLIHAILGKGLQHQT